MTTKIKTSEIGKSYWEENGAYNAEFSKLTKDLMPSEGCGATLTAEIVRAANRLYYEFCNNGNCNACEIHEGDEIETPCPYCCGSGYVGDDEDEECEECGGSGVIYEEGDSEIEIADFYANFINLIENTLIADGDEEIETICESIRTIIRDMPLYNRALRYTENNNMHQYDLLIDHVAAYAIEHVGENDSELPANYGNKD